MLEHKELIECLQGCRINNRGSQKKLYTSFYGFAMSVCYRYVNENEETKEVVNNGFLKVFKELCHFKASFDNEAASFIGWIRKIMINTAIDHYRKNKNQDLLQELNGTQEEICINGDSGIEKLSHDELMKVVQTLPPGYRIVFNLYVIEGMTHKQVAEQLNITEGSSKSNFAKARSFLLKKLVNNSL